MPVQVNWSDPYAGYNGPQSGWGHQGYGGVDAKGHPTANGSGAYLQQEQQQAQNAAKQDNQLMSRIGPAISQTDQGNQMQSRAAQEQALGMMRNAAQGNGPSVAQAQTYGNMGGGIAAMNAAAQGRGANVGGQIASGAQGMSTMSNQGAMGRSQEQNGLMNQYGKAAAGLNASDIGQYGMDLEQLNRARGLANQQAMLNANTTFGQNNLDMNQNLAKQAYLQQSGQLQRAAQNQATNQLIGGIGTGLGLMATTAALAA